MPSGPRTGWTRTSRYSGICSGAMEAEGNRLTCKNCLERIGFGYVAMRGVFQCRKEFPANRLAVTPPGKFFISPEHQAGGVGKRKATVGIRHQQGVALRVVQAGRLTGWHQPARRRKPPSCRALATASGSLNRTVSYPANESAWAGICPNTSTRVRGAGGASRKSFDVWHIASIPYKLGASQELTRHG